MTDKEKFRLFLEKYEGDSLEDALVEFVYRNQDIFTARKIMGLIERLQHLLKDWINDLEFVRKICHERGEQLQNYLEGKMWATEEDAKKNLQPQIENAQIIAEVTK